MDVLMIVKNYFKRFIKSRLSNRRNMALKIGGEGDYMGDFEIARYTRLVNI